MRVLGTTLSFGSATATHGGGLLRGDIFLDRGTLQVYGDQKSMPPVTYVVGAGGAADGAINGSGAIRLRPFAIFQSNQVGTEAEPMTTVQLAEASRFQMYDGIWASDVTIDSASMAAISGDVHIENLTLTGSAAHAQATLGDIYLGNVISDSPDDELFAQANIQADEGNVAISGDLTLSKGLTSIIAGKDITIGNGEGSITGPGELYVKAGGDVNVASAHMEESNIKALRMNVGEGLVAKNVLAAQLLTNTLEVRENLEIQGNSVNIFGTQVDYGLLQITGEGNKVGGNLSVFDAKLDIPDLAVGGNANLSAVSGSFDTISVGNTLDFAAGDLTGNALTAKKMIVGEAEYATTLNAANIAFDALKIGRDGIVNTDAIAAPGGSIYLTDGGALNLSGGDLGSQATPLGSVFVGSGSDLGAPGSIFAASLAGNGAGAVTALDSIAISDAISGNLHLEAGGDIEAASIGATSLKAKNVSALAGSLNLAEASAISGDLLIYGPGERGRSADAAQGAFDSLTVGGTMTLGGSDLTGRELAAGTVLVGSRSIPTTLNVEQMADGFGLGAGGNAWVSFGQPDDQWLKATIAASSERSAASAAVGVYTPVKVGASGVTLDPSQARAASRQA